MTDKDREEAIRHFSEKFRDVTPGSLRLSLVECAMEGYDYAASQLNLYDWKIDDQTTAT